MSNKKSGQVCTGLEIVELLNIQAWKKWLGSEFKSVGKVSCCASLGKPS